MVLSTPAMCSGVSGKARSNCGRNAKAQTNCIAITVCLAANHCTQSTVGELLLKSAT